MRRIRFAGAAALALTLAAAALAQQHEHAGSMSRHGAASSNAGAEADERTPPMDARVAVQFPQALREHTLANMRDHLLALQQVQEALAVPDYDQAAATAEQRLGMTSLQLHGAHEVAKYMPQGMRAAGTAMHRAASQFALAAQESSATGDIKPTLAALSRVTASCVACHAGYRLQ